MISKSPVAKRWMLFLLSLLTLPVFAEHHPNPFVLNKGQWEGPFSHKVSLQNLTVFAESEGFTFLASEVVEHDHPGHSEPHHVHEIPEFITMHAFRLRYLGAEPLVFQGREELTAYHNYFLGNDPERWQGHVPLYKELETNEFYNGIKLLAYSGGEGFKYDYRLEAGADPAQIEFAYSGLDDLELVDGNLVLTTSVGDLVESIPMSYQIINGTQVEVACRYVELGEGVYGFEFPSGYDENHPMVIDPVLVAATLSGTTGGGSNYGHGAAFDLAENIYTHAISFGTAYPTDEGSFQQSYGGGGTDAAISKLTPDGSDLIYATFLGGAQGEYPISTIANNDQELYVYGITASNDYPVDGNAFQSEYGGGGDDIFITGLSADGSEIIGSTYIGGSEVDGRNQLGFGYDAYRGEINLNFDGEVYLASSSSSANFPVTDGSYQSTKGSGQDALILKFSPDLSEMIWGTFLGSNDDDMAYGIRVKDDQTVYISGAVGSNFGTGTGNGFPTTAGAYQTSYAGGATDGFVARLSADGSELLHSTFLGESSGDKSYFLDFDNQDDVWVYMQSQSSWDVTDGVWGTGSGNILVHKLNEDLSELLVTSYLTDQSGGTGTPVAFMVDLCNDIYISAFGTTGGGFVPSEDAIFSTGGFYVGVYEAEMTDLVYGTYYTGNHVDGGTSRFDKRGIVYQGVCSGGGFNTTDDAWATNQSTSWDIGVFKIDFEIETVNAVAGALGQLTGCAPHDVDFQNFSEGVSFNWDFGTGDTSDEFEPSYTFEEEGEYLVTLVVVDSNSCNISDTAYVPIQVFEPVEFFADYEYNIDCETGTIEIIDSSQGPSDMEYEWNMGDGTILNESDPVHTYAEPGEYTITLTLETEACNETIVEEFTVEYVPFVQADFSASVIDFCDEFLVAVFDGSDNAEEYEWNMGDGTILTDPGSFEYNYESSGTYEIQLIVSSEEACVGTDTLVTTIEIPEPPVLDPELELFQQGLCEELNAVGVLDPNGSAGTFSWILDGEEIGTEGSVEFSVNQPGVYELVVVVVDAVCEEVYTVTDEFEFFDNLGYDLPPSLVLCYYEDNEVLDATVPYPDATYNWNNGLSNEPVLVVTEEGEYTVQVSYNGCIDEQSTDINEGGEFPLGFEAMICEDQPNQIFFPETQFVDTVIWDNGQTGFEIEISQSGYYPFTAIDVIGCDQIDSLLAIPFDDDPNIEIPNVFTPNGDGRNDLWQIQGDSLVFYELMVFNRWGRKVFETNEVYGSWDGSNEEGSGNDHNEDTFMYILKYRDRCDLQNQVLNGNVKVLR